MAKENKKYFWFKLKEDFFLSKEIKIIRKLPSGADILIVLLKLQLHSLKTGGIIEIDGLCDTLEEELHVLIDEDIKLIKLALMAFEKFSLVNIVNKKDIQMLLHDELIGSETASTIRSRQSRANKENLLLLEQKALHCNTHATKCNTDIEIDIEKDKEKDKEIDIEKEKDKEKDINIYQETFLYYLSKNNLIKHKEFTEPMKKAINKAIKSYKLDIEYIKKIIDRHSDKVEATKNNGQFKIKTRSLAELFGQKKKDSEDLICVDYLDEIYKAAGKAAEPQQPVKKDWGFETE